MVAQSSLRPAEEWRQSAHPSRPTYIDKLRAKVDEASGALHQAIEALSRQSREKLVPVLAVGAPRRLQIGLGPDALERIRAKARNLRVSRQRRQRRHRRDACIAKFRRLASRDVRNHAEVV